MIKYSKITKEDREPLTVFYEKYLNSGELIRQSIQIQFEKNAYFGYKAEDAGNGIAYFAFQEGFAMTCPHEELQREVTEILGNSRYATVDALMVANRYRGYGIAKELAKRNLFELNKRKTDYFVVEIWVYPDGSSPAKGIYESMGEVVYSRFVPGFYKNIAHMGIGCPICGKKCVCSAVLEVIRLG